MRRKSKAKWAKWRHPQGIDISLKKEDGALPKTGYRTPKEIRFLHPSGFEEAYVRNTSELAGIKKGAVVRISGTVGKKNRKTIVVAAKELGIRVLNRGFQ
ncbi:MAG: eL32 family ribosomal protein [archaeon]|nr:eL32 family ribosomal protein [archaeon]